MNGMRVALMVVCLLGVALGAAPVATSTSFQFKNITVGGMKILLMITKVTFDQNIYIRGVAITHVNMTDNGEDPESGVMPSDKEQCEGNGNGGKGGPQFPAITKWMHHRANMTFDGSPVVFKTDPTLTDPSGNMPAYLFAGQATQDPGSTFLGVLGGKAMPEAVDPKSIVFVKLLAASKGGGGGGGTIYLVPEWTHAAAAEATARIKMIRFFGGITNAAGEVVSSAPITVTNKVTPQCTADGITAFGAAFTYTQGLARSLLNNAANLESFKFQLGSLESRDVLTACKKVVDPMFTKRQVQVVIPGTTSCYFNYGTPEYATSACCNNTLRNSQCCSATDTTATITKLNNVSTSVIAATCSTPNRIVPTILSYIRDQATVADEPVDEQALGTLWSAFYSTCQSLIYMKKCTVDSDCKYSGKCDKDGNGQCQVPYGLDYALALTCFWDNMMPDLKTNLGIGWNLPANDPVAFKAGFMARLNKTFVMQDCMGNGDLRGLTQDCNCRRQQNSNNWACTFQAANQTACLEKKQCNWNNNYVTSAQCLQTSPVDRYTSFCGQCWTDNNCWSQTQPDLCTVNSIQSESACTTAGLYWHAPHGGSWGQCVDPARNTSDTCTPSNVCPAMTYSWNCNQPMCYARVTESVCRAAQSSPQTFGGDGQQYTPYWNQKSANNTGLCTVNQWNWWSGTPFTQAFCNQFSASLGGAAVTMFRGYQWQDGQFNTPAKCNAGFCSWQDPKGMSGDTRWLSGRDCTSKQSCTKSCPKCRGNYNMENYCYATWTNITQQTCMNSPFNGQWYQSVVGTAGRCFLGNGAYTEAQCTAAGASMQRPVAFKTCSGLSQLTCSSTDLGEINTWANCQWNSWNQCPSQEQCATSGQCDDWDKSTWGPRGMIPGACWVPNTPGDSGWGSNCNDVPSRVASARANSVKQTWARKPMTCNDPGATNSSMCAAIGGTWKLPALDKASCEADTACIPPGSNWPNAMNPAQCSLCAGTQTPIYTWSPGLWQNASIVSKFVWKTKAFSPVFTFGNRINQQVMWGGGGFINMAVQTYMASSQFSTLNSKFGGLVDVLSKVACDCTPGSAQRSCFGITAIAKSLGVVPPGGKVKMTSPLGTVIVTNGKTVGGGGARRLLAEQTLSITVYAVLANGLVSTNLQNVPNYAIVQATTMNPTIVGQLVGDGTRITGFTGGQATITLNYNVDITAGADYTVVGIGKLTGTIVTPMLNMVLTTTSGSVTTNNITVDGTYFPIKLLSNWVSLMSAPFTTITTSAAPGAQQVATSPATTVPAAANPTTATPAAPTTKPTSGSTILTASFTLAIIAAAVMFFPLA